MKGLSFSFCVRYSSVTFPLILTFHHEIKFDRVLNKQKTYNSEIHKCIDSGTPYILYKEYSGLARWDSTSANLKV